MLITSLAGGGAERLVSELSMNFSSNIKARIVTLTDEIVYASREQPISMNLNLKSDHFLVDIYLIAYGIIKYRKIIREYNPAVSLSFLVLDNFINVISNLRNDKTKVIVSVHTALSKKFQGPLRSLLGRCLINIIYNRADVIIAVSEGVKQELINNFGIDGGKIVIIYNPIDMKKIENLSLEGVTDSWFNSPVPILINIGGLKTAKGQWHLIRSFSKVRKNRSCKLIICGEGSLKPYLEFLINSLNLADEVRLIGWTDNPFKYLAKSTIFVFSSIWEALPYALIEAMACGCPIITADCKHGPREILGNDEYGIIVNQMDGKFYRPRDPLTLEENRLAEEIIKLLDDEVTRLWYSEKAKEKAKDFDVNKIIKKYEDVINYDS